MCKQTCAEVTGSPPSCKKKLTESHTPLLIIPPSLQLGSRSSAQCLAVDVCIYFHQPLDEGSNMAYKVVIKLIIREGHLR
ncbi:Uncharacterised protein [Chlamydia trachomatis]|nr:Uncharacterised protein [Chlamydia trachomatis]